MGFSFITDSFLFGIVEHSNPPIIFHATNNRTNSPNPNMTYTKILVKFSLNDISTLTNRDELMC